MLGASPAGAACWLGVSGRDLQAGAGLYTCWGSVQREHCLSRLAMRHCLHFRRLNLNSTQSCCCCCFCTAPSRQGTLQDSGQAVHDQSNISNTAGPAEPSEGAPKAPCRDLSYSLCCKLLPAPCLPSAGAGVQHMPLMASSNRIGQAAGWRRLRAMVNVPESAGVTAPRP